VATYREARESLLAAMRVFREAEDNRSDDYFIERVKTIDQLLVIFHQKPDFPCL
jgi:hypothetical protein